MKLISRTFIFLTLLQVGLFPSVIASQPATQGESLAHFKRLVTDAEHQEFLESTLNDAKHTVMISSYEVSPSFLNLDSSLINAAQRGVKVYIYYEHLKGFTPEQELFLKDITRACAKFESNCNHSKIVMQDDYTVAIGSYNWLSHFNDTGSNATIVTRGPLASNLKKDIWQGMRFYQSLQHDNQKGVVKFFNEKQSFVPIEYKLSSVSCAMILRTPEAHHELLKSRLAQAKRNITIFSPFVRLDRLQELFTSSVLQNLNDRRVKTLLVMLPNPNKNKAELAKLYDVLKTMSAQYPCFSYQVQNDFHAKTLVCDDMICEGSFNWLSAVSNTDHDANNYEVSMAIRGEYATTLLENYLQSKLGQVVDATSTVADEMISERSSSSEEAVSVTHSAVSSPAAGFEKRIQIFSGAKFHKQGFCVTLDRQYIKDSRGKTVYFGTEDEAREAAYEMSLAGMVPDDHATPPQKDKKRAREVPAEDVPYQNAPTKFKAHRANSIPADFDQHIRIYSGANFGKQGFCVRLDGNYLMDDNNNIVYFYNQFQAKKAAFEVWSSTNY